LRSSNLSAGDRNRLAGNRCRALAAEPDHGVRNLVRAVHPALRIACGERGAGIRLALAGPGDDVGDRRADAVAGPGDDGVSAFEWQRIYDANRLKMIET
jgi:hypothetical protein